MPNQFEDELRKQITEKEAASPAMRTEIYDRFWLDLESKISQYKNASQRDNLYIACKKNFDDAISAIESEFIFNPPTISRLTKIVEFTKRRFLKLTAIIGILTAVSDFLKPIGEYTSYILYIGGLGAVLSWSIRKTRWLSAHHNNFRDIALSCSILAACSGGMLAFQSIVPAAEKNGALAALVPGAKKLQSTIFRMDRNLETVGKNTRDIAENTKIIAEGQSVLKRETSEDSFKELVNLGFGASRSNIMYTAIQNFDDKAIRLLFNGGTILTKSDWINLLSSQELKEQMDNTNIVAALRLFKEQITSSICKIDDENDIDKVYYYLLSIKISEFKFYCKFEKNVIYNKIYNFHSSEWIRICSDYLERKNSFIMDSSRKLDLTQIKNECYYENKEKFVKKHDMLVVFRDGMANALVFARRSDVLARISKEW